MVFQKQNTKPLKDNSSVMLRNRPTINLILAVITGPNLLHPKDDISEVSAIDALKAPLLIEATPRSQIYEKEKQYYHLVDH